ncbi:hypothetical protein PGT21_015942 [Puccinia graminis f. sp. tritici]|uniref:SAM-dependent MTase RsmB/NOP-type domain-containing protein n=2 Tax=Puccinia graminis f. sp. tritici TaxID=56615 RepID=A0A5B0LN21_PUCGR|nr:hypothetical protein PGT21_015942 [Puccinia graminis f. sp. tritici]KAA1078690.1 hypothetical protein PGTUg99_015340 [Puccinia graminis f. sp. tritici]KAA1130532.1 hypothetical protein PGTUg99_017573 [Puccinia graminis f. sp. tritici]
MGKPRNKSRSNNNQGGDIRVKKSTQRWDSLPETNEAFVEYYKNQQKIAETEEEWNQIFTSFRTDLPTTFRVTGGKKNATQLNKIIEDTYVPFLSNLRINNELVPPPQKISWYPNGLAWEFRAPKQLIRKFQNFLVYESEAGNLSRQEAVSMIPPLLLDVQSHHYVLDACAAPGSKTAQLVESLHNTNQGLIPEGIVIANDSDYKRSHLLVHQSLRRLPSPSTMVTNHDASRFPTLSMNGKKLLFDRILCDVPCSGDGTLRKNGGIWRDWSPANGIGLHGLQLRILSRAISLLKPGGRIVYSTCSLNPLENEAVVSAALSRFPSMSIKDVSSSLPTLVRRPGLTSWTVTTREPNNIQPVASPNDLPNLPPNRRYPATLWPSGQESKHGLERCLRIYPHLQDTGGFFVAVLEKSVAATNGDATCTNPPETLPITETSPVKVEAVSENGLPNGHDSLPPTAEVTLADGISIKQNPTQLAGGQGTVNTPTQVAVDDRVSNEETTEQTTNQTTTQIESTEQPGPSCTLSEPVESKQTKRPIPTEEVETSSSQPDSKRTKVEPSVEGTMSIVDAPKVGSVENRTDPQNLADSMPLDNPFKEEPHVFLKSDNEEIKRCMEYYDINPTFPADNLLVRNAEGLPTRTIYLTSSVVREVIENNSHVRLRLICCGVKIFCRQDPSAATIKDMKAADPEKFCKWRIVSDGIDFFRPFMGSKRVIQCHINVLKQLMRHDQQYPLITDLQDEAFRNQVRQLDIGSCVAEIFDDTQDEGSHHVPLDLMVGLWISKSSVNLMVDKKERKVLSLRLWGEDITLDPNAETRASRLAKNQNQDPVNPDGEVKLEAQEVKPEAEEVKLEAEQVKPEAGEVKLEPAEVKLEPAESKLEPAEVKVEPVESKVEPGATALNADHSEAPTVKTEASLPADEIKPDGEEANI